ncbi:MAG TPA: glycosyltransferase family 4 protein [Burkholderiales bacterium]|nr:glycosyltransferase family 4 protein [Burkholderiales bacterium]
MFVTGCLFTGGAERHAVSVMSRLAERGHQCHAVSVKQPRGMGLRLSGGGTLRSLHASGYLDANAVMDFAAHISTIKPSAIVAANAYALMYAWLALRLSRPRAALMVTYHSSQLLAIKERLQMLLYRLFFRTADCSVFVCHTQRRYWERRGVFSRRNEVIYNGVDTDAFRDRWSAEERLALRCALGFSEADYVIGLSALLRPEKNHVQLVDAVARLCSTGISARALMIGDGETRALIEARARTLGVSNRIAITGLKEDVRPYVAACDVMALCSLTETFSLAAIEAMALSRPVVHSDVGGAAEMIAPGKTGFLFPVGNTEAFVEKLAILSDRSVSRQMGREARATVETLFSEKTMVDRYERTLEEICAAVHPEHADRINATH